MAITHKINLRWSNDSANISGTLVQTAESEINQDIPVPGGGENVTDMAVVQARIKSLYLMSDQDVTVTSLDAEEEEVDTIALKANAPLGWQTATGQECPFTADFAQLGFANAGTDAAVVYVRVLYDATP